VHALILQFDPLDPPEHLGERLTAAGVDYHVIRLDLPHEPLSLDDCSLLIALGGSMNVDQIDSFPFLAEAKDTVRTALNRRLPYLGLCLGGQLLARTLGAPVVSTPQPEIGVVPVTLDQTAADPILNGLGPTIPTLQFHLDTFHLPPGSRLLASSAACSNQLARCGDLAYAVQFHPETNLDTFIRWLEDDYRTTVPTATDETVTAAIEDVRAHWPAIRRHADRFLDNFIQIAR
jgi:GMP synthase (glutamine-hydrolysing)